MDEIINRVQNSGLTAIDLADYLPAATHFVGFDFAPYLWNGLVLKEKDFRAFMAEYDWNQLQDKHVYLFCSVEAILPSWSFMLVTSRLTGIAKTVTIGELSEARQTAITSAIAALDQQSFVDAKLIVKGCSDIPSPEAVMALFVQKVQPVCSSIMYGEPCSTVPIYKRLKK